MLWSALLVLALLITAPVFAHHSYGDIDRDRSITLSGTLDDITFANPHVMLRVRADDGVTYAVDWMNLTQLARMGVTKATLKVGERVTVTGNPHRDPWKKHVALLTEVTRPLDGWKWERYAPPVAARR